MSTPSTFTPAREPIWLCLYFARLALEVFAPNDAARASAVIEQRRVHCANRENLPAGLTLASAQALCADLLALERQPEREREALQQLAHWAYQFTPGVVIGDDNSLLLEIGSCQRLHRGLYRLLQKLQLALQQRQHAAQFGLAQTPKAAWLLAHAGYQPAVQNARIDHARLQQQLDAVPVAVLDIAHTTSRALEQMGITILGALYALPSAALGKRFGADFIDYLQKVSGAQPDPQTFFTPAPNFQHGSIFIDGIAQRQMLLFPMKRLLQKLDDYLRARQLHCHTLRWQLFDAHRLQNEFSVELSRVQNRWSTLLELSRLKLEQVELAQPVFSISLACDKFFEAAPAAQQLFPDENDQREAAAALVDRLHARLGAGAVQGVSLRESHWPEAAAGSGADRSMHAQIAQAPRPLWLLTQPQPLAERDGKPCWPTSLTLLRGPERIGNHWWEEEENERDYYIARNARGIVCWIFRERMTQRWFLHGLFS